MNGPSGFGEVRSSTSRSSTNRFLDQHRYQFGTGAWHFLRTYDLIALSTGISMEREKIPDTIFMSLMNASMHRGR